MPIADYDAYDALGLAGLVRSGAVTPTELLNEALARITVTQPVLNAIVHQFEDLARMQIADGLPKGPFCGVPIVLKNTGIAVGGTHLSTGSKLFADAVTPKDGTLAARYKAAGLVLLAKTNTPEFALSFTTEPEFSGPTRNPWDLARSPGGSSGGSAAAVAAGIVPLAHASDGAGSTRLPASHCGLFGFKPSRIRNPMGPDLAEGIAGMSTPHALSRSVRDNAALLDVSSGPDVGDPYCCPPNAKPFLAELDADPRPLKIGLVTASPFGPVDPACRAAARAAAALCESLGHTVEDAVLDYDAAGLKAAWRVIGGVGVATQVGLRAKALGLADPLAVLEPVNAAWVEEGRGISGSTYLGAVNALHRTSRAMGRFFSAYDILLSPTTAAPAPLLGEMAGRGQTLDGFYDQFWAHGPFTCVFNASGCPAMSVPLGMTDSGLPVGVQFGAAFGGDGLLFALAGQLERTAPWAGRRPPVTASSLRLKKAA